MTSQVTEAQKQRMEENRQRALAIKRAREQQASSFNSLANHAVVRNTEVTTSLTRPSSGEGPSPPKQSMMSGPVSSSGVIQVVSHPKATAFPFAAKSSLSSSEKTRSKMQLLPHQSMKGQKVLSSYFNQNQAHSTSNARSKDQAKALITSSSPKVIPENVSNGKKDNEKDKALKITFKLMSASQVFVDFSYSSKMINTIKEFKSSSFDAKTRRWTISVTDYLPLIKRLDELKKSGVLPTSLSKESVPPAVISVIASESQVHKRDIDLSERLPKDFIDSMFPFQREGVKFAIRKEGKCMIADEMGLGKTIQALGTAFWFRDDWPLIVICPASVAVTWKQQILKWLTFVEEDQVCIADKMKNNRFPQSPVIIMSYDRLTRNLQDVLKTKSNFVIFDESHSIKDEKAHRTKAALEVAKKSRRVLLLSGTPALSRPIELLTQIRAINPKLFPKKHDFGIRYCDGSQRWMGRIQMWDFKGHSNTDELRILLESTIMIRRMKKDVLRDLPKKSRVVVELPVDMTVEQKMQMQGFKERVGNKMTVQTREDLMKWYNDSAIVKIPAVIKYLKKKLKFDNNSGKKFIVFVHHKVVVDAVTNWLTEQKVSYIVITGETPPKNRQDCCDAFQSRPQITVAVVSIVAAGVGITLTAAHQVLFAELFWNPGILIQAEDRAHRIGQEENVTIEYLISKGTVDDVIWSIVGKKLSVLSKVGLASESMKTALRSSNQNVIENYFKKIATDILKKEGADEEQLLALNDDSPEVPGDDLEILEQNHASPDIDFDADTEVEDEPEAGPSGVNADVEDFPDDDDDLVMDIESSPQVIEQSTADQRDKNAKITEDDQFIDLGDDDFDDDIECLD